MRIFLASVVILLGANLAVDLMDSDMVELMQERNEQIQRTIALSFLTSLLLSLTVTAQVGLP